MSIIFEIIYSIKTLYIIHFHTTVYSSSYFQKPWSKSHTGEGQTKIFEKQKAVTYNVTTRYKKMEYANSHLYLGFFILIQF